LVLALLVGAPGSGCDPSSTHPNADGGTGPGPDGGGGGGDASDASDAAGQSGLALTFGSVPILPGSIPGDFPAELREARIELEDLRAVGDAAVGDERTTEPFLLLRWGEEDDDDEEEGEDELGPGEDDDDDEGDIRVFFENAPPGMYSHILADAVTYRMSGSVTVDGKTFPFRIDDTPPTALSISVALGEFELEASSTGTISVKAALSAAIAEPRWDEIEPSGGGELRIDGSSDQIGTVREKLGDGFQFDPDGSE
jgi:hypothetical protein